jgi:pyruvate/2-oxoglutarate dehydrogenase complex dihydrolipoamide dehydrogenase (E3) component
VFTVQVDAQGTTLPVADMVVHGAGRVPEIDDLNLDEAAERIAAIGGQTASVCGWSYGRSIL